MPHPLDFEITSHRPVIGRFIVAYKKLIRFLISPYLKGIFERDHKIAGRMTDLDGLLEENLRTMSESLGTMVSESHQALLGYQKALDDRLIQTNHKIDDIFKHADVLFQTIDQKAETLAVRQDTVEGHLGEIERATEEFQARVEGLENFFNSRKEEIEKLVGELSLKEAELEKGLVSVKEKTKRRMGELSRTFREMDIGVTVQKRRLDSILVELRKKAGLDKASMKKIAEVRERLDDHLYLLFENRFRGTSEDIKNRQEVYLPLFLDMRNGGGGAVVLDIGCGRGEFLEILNENSIPAKGVDLNEEMVLICKEKGLDVEEADAMAYLKGIKNNSLGGIIACQFVEHLPVEVLTEFVKLCHDKVKKGGRVVFETINPESVFAMKWFYIDMTHQKPVHPQAISFLMESTGFRNMEIKYLSPVATDLRLNAKGDSNMEKLNNLLFGCQDYAVIATK